MPLGPFAVSGKRFMVRVTSILCVAVLAVLAEKTAWGDDPGSPAGDAAANTARRPVASSFAGIRWPSGPSSSGQASSGQTTAARPVETPVSTVRNAQNQRHGSSATGNNGQAPAASRYPNAKPLPVAAAKPGSASGYLRPIPTGRASGAVRVPTVDRQVTRTQATSPDLRRTPAADAPSMPAPSVSVPTASIGGQSIGMEAALYGTLTANPDLVTLRQGTPIANAPSPEAVEVARRFPAALNPTVWIDFRPITLVPAGTFGNGITGGRVGSSHHGFYQYGQAYILVSIRQPLELGHQTTHRYHIALASYDQQRWTVLQAELTALVQTYRFFQTAAYRREKYHLAQELADFNDRLAQTLERRLQANQVPAADVVFARVESRATRQAVKAARQDYLTALTDLRNQIGNPEQAGTAEPLGEFTLPPYIPPVDEETMVQQALQTRPDIHAAQALVRAADSAVRLAKGDMIPTPVVGPQYAMDEAGVQYIGLVIVSPLPILNCGKPLVHQRQAELQRALVAAEEARQRATSQVRAAVAKWNAATDLVNDSKSLSDELGKEVAALEQLFEANQADLSRLMQARQRLIQLDNSRLDAVWAATQAQADLLLALGAPNLINAMLNQAERDAGTTPTVPSASAPAPAPNPAVAAQPPASSTAVRR
jgi:cobalt-zinc-cadmium efflux system outer membrane protein